MNKDLLEGDVWEQGWTAEQPFFKAFAQMEILARCRKTIGVTGGHYLIYGECGVVHAFISKATYQMIKESGKQLSERRIAEQVIQDINKTIESFLICVRKLRAQVLSESLHSASFIHQFKEFDVLVLKIFAYFRTTWEATVACLEEQLSVLLKNQLTEGWQEACVLAATPIEPDLLFREKSDWVNVLEKPTEANIQNYMLRYPYHFCNIDSDSDAMNIMRERLKKDSAVALKGELEKSRRNVKARKLNQKQLFDNINSQEVKHIAHVLQQFALLRLELKNCWAGIHYLLFPLFKRIAETTGQSIRDIMMFWSIKDILAFLERRNALSKDDTTKRQHFYLLLFQDDRLSLWIGPEAERKKKEILDKYLPKRVNSFKGSVACRGNVTGVVKIVAFDDLRIIERTAREMKNKMILVTGMTNPSMMPLIKKANAIVTDEGGITCHAAIISREFNIPCIVGTKIATQVLKDWDIIEVNANEGIVRIVK